MLRRGATSNTEQEGDREEKREANGGSVQVRGGEGSGGRDEPAKADGRRWSAGVSEGKKNERERAKRRRKTERIEREYDFSSASI